MKRTKVATRQSDTLVSQRNAMEKKGSHIVTRLMDYLTFDDVLILPGYSDFSRSDIEISTQLTRRISLKIPLVAAPMDTVCDSRLAIALGKLGGMGIIHRNLTIEEQANEIKKVKKEGLLAAAAIGSNTGYEERVKALIEASVDILLVDSAHGFAKSVIETTKFVRRMYPNIQIIAGNIATGDAATALINA